ncbi:MAG: fatty acid desaturase [Halomonadaceae bacterium]|nr:MAG: fatty acid desaturase [Halomonadaceae bacterium]
MSATSTEKTVNQDQQIQQELRQVSDGVRARNPWLRHQNTIGMGIFLISIAGIIANAWLYMAGIMPAWAVILLTAFWASLLHELEHDLIHWMYFKKQPLLHHLMMLGVYLARPTTINPWIRRGMHFRHHKISGTETDIEERGITLGERWGLRRFFMVGDNMLAFYLRSKKYLSEPRRLYREGKIDRRDIKNLRLISAFGFNPLGVIVYGIWHLFVLYYLVTGIAWLFGATVPWPGFVEANMGWMTTAVVVLIAPNVLRTYCLHFISSNMHYYGDVEPGKISEQCQVLNVWWLLPVQAFCCNFGSTHAIHHFVVRDPFYVRQMAAKESHEVLRKYGIRFNDLGTFRRANRLHERPARAGTA